MKVSRPYSGFIVLSAALFLVAATQRITAEADSKTHAKASEVKVSQNTSVRDILAQTKQVVVFQRGGMERKYVGNFSQNSSALQKFHSTLSEGTDAKETDLRRIDYELAFVGGSSYWLAKYDVSEGIIAIYTVHQNQLLPAGALKLTHSLQTFFASAKPMSQSQAKTVSRPSPLASSDIISSSPQLGEVVQRSPLILIGTPVATLDDRYDPAMPRRYTVYLIGVETYLKDATGLDLPIVVLNHVNHHGPHDPPPQFGELYLFFLTPPRGDSIVLYSKTEKPQVIKIFEPGEYDHFPEAIIQKGQVIPVSEWDAPNWIPWLKGTEREVIRRVNAEVKRQQKGLNIR